METIMTLECKCHGVTELVWVNVTGEYFVITNNRGVKKRKYAGVTLAMATKNFNYLNERRHGGTHPRDAG